MVILVELINLYSLVVLAAVVLSWFPTARSHPIARFVESATEPALVRIRAVLPSFGGLDLSPMVLLFALRLLGRLLS